MRDIGPFDYVIVGAGTAGCLLANRLSADPNNTVLLLEAGGKDDWIWIHIPVGYLYCIGNPRTDWCYKTEPDPGLNGRSILYARGRVLGGSSSINAMLYLRGQAARLRRMGAAQPAIRAGRGRACCRSSRNPRTTGAARTSSTARAPAATARARMARRAPAPVLGDPGCVSRRRARGRHRQGRGLQPRRQRRQLADSK